MRAREPAADEALASFATGERLPLDFSRKTAFRKVAQRPMQGKSHPFFDRFHLLSSHIMNHHSHHRRGFTLVEVMLVVAILGLLAAMAVPAWQRVRLNAIRSTMDNDARQLAGAAQQYFLEYRVVTVALTYTDGAIGGPLAEHVRFIGTHYTDVPTALTSGSPFSLNHPHLPAPRAYSEDGQNTP